MIFYQCGITFIVSWGGDFICVVQGSFDPWPLVGGEFGQERPTRQDKGWGLGPYIVTPVPPLLALVGLILHTPLPHPNPCLITYTVYIKGNLVFTFIACAVKHLNPFNKMLSGSQMTGPSQSQNVRMLKVVCTICQFWAFLGLYLGKECPSSVGFFHIFWICQDILKIVEIIHEAPQRPAHRADNFPPVINHPVRGRTLMAGLGKVIAKNRIKCSI